jgi:maltooligosyltrehalose trehalohydrolase
MLFQGEEWGAGSPFQYFTDHEPELGRAVSEGRRQEFSRFDWDPTDVPDPQAPSTFETSRLRWHELDDREHADLLDWHRALIAMRRRFADLSDPRLDRISVDVDEDRATVLVRRGSIELVVNLGPADAEFAVGSSPEVLLASDRRIRARDRALVVPADAVAVIRRG